ncbi:MAG: hypothetical protein C7M88_08820, partial [Candidatus Arcticimaribacter sp.]
TLSTEVKGLSQVQSDLSALSSLVGNLSTAVGALPDPSTSIQAIATGLDAATTQITAIEAALADGVASAADLAAIDLLIDAVQADITTLLSENAAISVPITIEDTETLENAQKFIKVGEGTPSGYLLSGNLTVNYNSTTASLTAAERVTANELTAKIISVTGDVVIDGAVNLAGLTYINGNYTINGTEEPVDATVRNISGNLTVDGELGALDLSHISTVGNVTITNPASVTSLNLTASTGGDFNTDGSAAGIAVFSDATGDITIGSGFDMSSVTANKSLGAITLNQAAAAAAFVVNAPKAATITANALVSVVSATTITGSTTTNVFLNALKTSGGSLSNATNKLNEFHFPALVSSVSGINVDAKTVNAAGLTTVETVAADFNTSNAVILTSLVDVKEVLTLATAPVNIPLAQFSGAGLLTSAATTVIVGGVSDANMNELDASHVYLTLMNQNADITLDATENANLVEFTATASGTGATIDFIGTAAPALAVLTINGFDTFTMAAQVAPTTLTTVTTGGTMRTFSSIGNTGLRSLTVGHTYAPAYTSAQIFVLTGAIDTAFTSLDLASVVRLKGATITGNTSLATILAPATTDLLTAGANTGGAVLYTVSDNSLTATYTAAVAPVSNGVTNTAAIPVRIQQASLLSWKTYINANTTLNSTTFSLDYDISNGGVANDFNADTSGGVINTAAELALIE